MAMKIEKGHDFVTSTHSGLRTGWMTTWFRNWLLVRGKEEREENVDSEISTLRDKIEVDNIICYW